MNRLQSILIVLALCGGTFAMSACDRTPEQAHEQAVDTQHEAAQDIHDNNQKALHTIAEAEHEAAKTAATATRATDEAATEANKKVDEAKQQARADNAQVQATANKEIRADNVVAEGDKSDLRLWGQKKLDGLSNMIDEARVNAQKAPAKVPANFEGGLKEVQTKRDELSTELASIETQGAQKSSAFKTRMNSEVDQLKTRIETLDRSLR
ncbi:MAG TPA: hypothetical protein VF331_23985 [Polyangiales bacterium]